MGLKYLISIINKCELVNEYTYQTEIKNANNFCLTLHNKKSKIDLFIMFKHEHNLINIYIKNGHVAIILNNDNLNLLKLHLIEKFKIPFPVEFCLWFSSCCMNSTKHYKYGNHQLTNIQYRKSTQDYKNKLNKNIITSFKSSEDDFKSLIKKLDSFKKGM